MFSYVNKSIREKFIENGKLVTVNKDGIPVEKEDDVSAFISILGPVPLPIMIRNKEVTFSWFPFVRRVQLNHVLNAANKVKHGKEENFRELIQTNMSVNSLLASPGFLENSNPPVRVHSCCMTGDIFGSLRCECGSQLDSAFEYAFKEDGAVIYMSGHEGRGIGLWAKAMTYLLQDEGQDTYEANISLNLPEDSRDFTDAAVILRYLLKEKPIRLLSNNPLKLDHLEKAGQSVTEVIPLVTGVGQHNIKYMKSKKSKGHMLPELD